MPYEIVRTITKRPLLSFVEDFGIGGSICTERSWETSLAALMSLIWATRARIFRSSQKIPYPDLMPLYVDPNGEVVED